MKSQLKHIKGLILTKTLKQKNIKPSAEAFVNKMPTLQFRTLKSDINLLECKDILMYTSQP